MKVSKEAIREARREIYLLGSASTTEHHEPSARTIALAALGIAGMNGTSAPRGFQSAVYLLNRVSHGWGPSTRELVQRTIWRQTSGTSWTGVGTHRYENVEKAAELLERAASLLHFHQEVAPGWVDGKKIYYADNSIVQMQVDRDGNRRSITLVGPGGDVCY